jgi:hypothetical protein
MCKEADVSEEMVDTRSKIKEKGYFPLEISLKSG